MIITLCQPQVIDSSDCVHKHVSDLAANMLKAFRDEESAECCAHALQRVVLVALNHPGKDVLIRCKDDV
jgi:hypothetical protein